MANLFRQSDRLSKAVPLAREERKEWSAKMTALRSELLREYREAAGHEADTACLAHLSRSKDHCFHCGEMIAGDDLVYCPTCSIPNFNW